jgi:hypothetical protein
MAQEKNFVDFLRELKSARAGEPVTGQHLKAQRVIMQYIRDGAFEINPMKLAHKHKLDSLTVQAVIRWWVGAGWLDRSTELNEINIYTLTEKFQHWFQLKPATVAPL